jgi:hypothetical protein
MVTAEIRFIPLILKVCVVPAPAMDTVGARKVPGYSKFLLLRVCNSRWRLLRNQRDEQSSESVCGATCVTFCFGLSGFVC